MKIMSYTNFWLILIRIKIKMVINLVRGLFTHNYPVDVYTPPYWSEDEFLQYVKVSEKLNEIYSSNESLEERAKYFFAELENLPSGAIVSAYNKTIIKTDIGWVKI